MLPGLSGQVIYKNNVLFLAVNSGKKQAGQPVRGCPAV
jgi:hypothetical protein